MASATTGSLISTLEDLIDQNQILLDLCENKQDALLDREVTELEPLTKRQQTVADRIDELNEKRRKLSRQLLPTSEEPISLDSVVSSLDGDLRKQLDARRLELKDLVRDIQRVSRENRRLLEDRIDVFNRLFEELQSETSQETYDKDKQKDQASNGEAILIDEAI